MASQTSDPQDTDPFSIGPQWRTECAAYIAALLALFFWAYLRSDLIFQREVLFSWRAVFGQHPSRLFDPLLASSVVALLIGLTISLGLESSIRRSMLQIRDERFFSLHAGSVAKLYQTYWVKTRRRLALRGAIIVASCVIVGTIYAKVIEAWIWIGTWEEFGWVYTYGCPRSDVDHDASAWIFQWFGWLACGKQTELFIASILLGAFFGARLGVLHAAAQLFQRLTRQDLTLLLVPNHPDTAGGMAPLGNVMFYAALMIVGTLSVVSALFFLAAGPWAARTDQDWLWLIAALFLVALGYGLYAFYLPFWRLSQRMRAEKARLTGVLLPELDTELSDARRAAESSDDPAAVRASLDKAVDLLKQRRAITDLSVWPIGSVGKRVLSIGTLLPLLPWLLRLVGIEQSWIAGFLRNFFNTVSG